MRCIEMKHYSDMLQGSIRINTNMRCIEMQLYVQSFEPIPGLTLT